MAENSKIEWTTHTFNPWVGCTKVSPACDNCYAETWAKRTGQPALWQGERRRTTAANWRQPLKWNREAEKAGRRDRVFCASLADVFDNQVPGSWRCDLWDLINQTPHLDWLLLTKRPQNIAKMLPTEAIGAPAWGQGWPNVWLGTTVENQAEADRRIPHLLAAPAAKRFLSCEPLLGPVDLTRICLAPRQPGSVRAGIHVNALAGRYVESGLDYVGAWDITKPMPIGLPRLNLDWIIAGGESGPGARPSHPDWFRSLRDLCAAADVRVQRLQEISEDDAQAEGLKCLSKDDGQTWKWGIPDRDGLPGKDDHGWPWFKWDVDPRRAFHFLWLDIYGPGAWDTNPEVVALTFTVAQRNIDA